jgi:hypothetical protein
MYQEKNCRIHRILRFVPQDYCGLYRRITVATAGHSQPSILSLFWHHNTSQKYDLPVMPTLIPDNNMARDRAGNTKRSAASNKKQAAAKTARTSVSSASAASRETETTRANLKKAPPPATTTATVASVAASETTNPTASVGTGVPVSSVHLRGTDGGSEHETGTDDLTKATADTTAAYGDLNSSAASHEQMMFTIRNYVTQHFFPNVKFITKKEKLAYYPPGTNTTSYCAIITRGCNLPPGVDYAQWWETVAKRTVKRKIAQLRSDKINALRKAYYGKSWASGQFQF